MIGLAFGRKRKAVRDDRERQIVVMFFIAVVLFAIAAAAFARSVMQ